MWASADSAEDLDLGMDVIRTIEHAPTGMKTAERRAFGIRNLLENDPHDTPFLPLKSFEEPAILRRRGPAAQSC